MSATSSSCAEVLRRLVVQNLSLFLYDNAKFYAERLYYEEPQPENLHLLGQSYFRQGKIKQTYLILQHSDWGTNRYLFALSCISLGKFSEAERALLSPITAKALLSKTVQLKDLESVPGGAAGLYLLGVICRKEQRKEAAIDYFQKSLQLDSAMWGSISQLSEMGIAVDTEKLFGIDTATALRVLCLEEHSVAIGSSASSALTSNTALHQEQDTENFGASTTTNDVEKHRVAVIERRRIAESLSDASTFSPRTAMSLGLSSLSLRIPFATPGSVPYVLPSMGGYSNPMTGPLGRGADTPGPRGTPPMSQMHSPMGLVGQYTDYSERRLSARDADFSRSLAAFDTEMRPKTSRVALFEKSFASPGRTPVPMPHERHLSTGLTPGCKDLTLRSGQSPGVIDGRTTPTALFNESTLDGDGPGDEYLTGGKGRSTMYPKVNGGGVPVSGQMMDRDLGPRGPGGLPPRGGAKDSVPNTSDASTSAHNPPGGRRVSFGPTARLSFSSVGRGMGGTGAGIFGEGDSEFEHKPSSSQGGTPSGPRDGDLLDEHPMKFQRCLDRDSGSNRDMYYNDHTPNDSYDFADGPSGQDPDTPHVRGYAKTVGQGQFNRGGSRNQEGPGSMSPIPLAVTPFPSDRDNMDYPSFSSTVETKAKGKGKGDRGKDDDDFEYDVRTSLKENKGGAGNHQNSNLNQNQRMFLASCEEGRSDFGQRGDEGFRSQIPRKNGVTLSGEGGWGEGVERALSLLTVFTSAYQLLCTFRCRECVALLHRLPRQHYLCGWVQHMLGKSYCEISEYQPAVLALREMLRLEPFRSEGTETLSTALWHLKKDKELCSLATQVVEVDKNCPQTWCVVGNCFSLQKEPEVALKYFSRALQIDPSFTYAHTLYGHELANNEDLDKAVQSFRNSLLHDERHYNAWYGLGSIYFRQEKYEMAEYHFRRALGINCASSVLRCYLSMSLHAQNEDNKSFEALDVLMQACKVDPKNPQLQYQRAHVLLALDHYEAAIEALDLVLTLAPKEAPVYSLLGQVHRTLGHPSEALKYFNIAISLDPKEGTALKAMLECIEEPPELDGILNGYLD